MTKTPKPLNTLSIRLESLKTSDHLDDLSVGRRIILI